MKGEGTYRHQKSPSGGLLYICFWSFAKLRFIGELEPIMLGQDEIERYKRRYDDEHAIYERASSVLLHKCLLYKSTHLKVVRIVFSRDPVVKSWSSLLKKNRR